MEKRKQMSRGVEMIKFGGTKKHGARSALIGLICIVSVFIIASFIILR